VRQDMDTWQSPGQGGQAAHRLMPAEPQGGSEAA
jgi:hypothetical protein